MTSFITTRSFLFLVFLLYPCCFGSEEADYRQDAEAGAEESLVPERCGTARTYNRRVPGKKICVWTYIQNSVSDGCPQYNFTIHHVVEGKDFCSLENGVATCICEETALDCFANFKNATMNKELQCIQEKWQDLIRKRRMIRAATSGATTMVTSSPAGSTGTNVATATPAPTTAAVTTLEAPKPIIPKETEDVNEPAEREDSETTAPETTESTEEDAKSKGGEKGAGKGNRPKYVYKNSTAFILSVIGCYACTFLLIQIIAIAILHKIEKRQSMNNLKEMVRNQRI